MSFSEDNQSDVIEAFNSTSWYLEVLLNIDDNIFNSMVNRIYPPELQLNKANVSESAVPFSDLHLSISDCFVKTKRRISIKFGLKISEKINFEYFP